MKKYAIRRVIMAIITLLVVACITFFLMNAIPGNPWLSEKTPSQATIDALNAKYGLDQPVIVQLGKYLGNLVQGDFVLLLSSLSTRKPPSKGLSGFSPAIFFAARRIRSLPISQMFLYPAL